MDHNTGLSRDVQVRCNGIYSYRITDPILFYKNVCGNVEMTYDREEIDGQLKTEFISALQPAFAQLSNWSFCQVISRHMREISKRR